LAANTNNTSLVWLNLLSSFFLIVKIQSLSGHSICNSGCGDGGGGGEDEEVEEEDKNVDVNDDDVDRKGWCR
jgi:hypothetical protein